MSRRTYFEAIKLSQSPIIKFADSLESLCKAASNNSVDDLLLFADLLSDLNTPASRSRSSFIRLSIGGIDVTEFFEEHRESWGIPKFEEDLISVDDFKNGFLWTFRDHTTSWSEDMEAREWFYANIEARFTRRYELWIDENGCDQSSTIEGDYKHILNTIIKGGCPDPLKSPVFSKAELEAFFENYDAKDDGIDQESLLKILEKNVNW